MFVGEMMGEGARVLGGRLVGEVEREGLNEVGKQTDYPRWLTMFRKTVC